MGCLLALIAAISPRVALVLVWLFTNLVVRAFTGFLLPLLGLVLLPLTTLLYVLAYQPVVGVRGWGWFLVVIGLLFDLGSYGGGARSRR
jgi:hypothetical protein